MSPIKPDTLGSERAAVGFGLRNCELWILLVRSWRAAVCPKADDAGSAATCVVMLTIDACKAVDALLRRHWRRRWWCWWWRWDECFYRRIVFPPPNHCSILNVYLVPKLPDRGCSAYGSENGSNPMVCCVAFVIMYVRINRGSLQLAVRGARITAIPRPMLQKGRGITTARVFSLTK